LWFRAYEINDEEDSVILNLNSHWRSRDEYKAWFMNAYAITELQSRVAKSLSEKIDRPVKVGSYMDVSDSLHIYGKYFEEAEPHINTMKTTPMDERRAYDKDHPFLVEQTRIARENLAKDPDYYKMGEYGRKEKGLN
jgi:thymidylate synthase